MGCLANVTLSSMIHFPLQIYPFIHRNLTTKICKQFISYALTDPEAQYILPKRFVYIKSGDFCINTPLKIPVFQQFRWITFKSDGVKHPKKKNVKWLKLRQSDFIKTQVNGSVRGSHKSLIVTRLFGNSLHCIMEPL